eukprot:5809069-Amphidinium_carterae.1
MVPSGTHIAPPSPYNDAQAATVPAVPGDVEMENQSGDVDGTQRAPAPWTPPEFTMDPADYPVVSPSAD